MSKISISTLVFLVFVVLCAPLDGQEGMLIPCEVGGWEDKVFEYDEIEIKPLFPGCAGQGDNMETIDCSNLELNRYFFKTIRYPRQARAKGVVGTVEAAFVINKEGQMVDIEIIDGDGDLAEEVRRVLKMMAKDITWTPGKCGNETVDVWYFLPWKFSLK